MWRGFLHCYTVNSTIPEDLVLINNLVHLVYQCLTYRNIYAHKTIHIIYKHAHNICMLDIKNFLFNMVFQICIFISIT